MQGGVKQCPSDTKYELRKQAYPQRCISYFAPVCFQAQR